MRTESDIINQRTFAYNKGVEEGMEKGIEKGKIAEKLLIAKKLKAMGIDVQSILNATELDMKDIID